MTNEFSLRTALRAGAAFFAIGSAGAAFGQDYRSTIAATNPIASFQLDAPDAPSSIGSYTTSWQNVTSGPGAPLASVPGNRGAAFDGSGATSAIITSLVGQTPGRGSINLWVNLAELPSDASRIFYLAGESTFANDFDFQIGSSNRPAICVGAGQCLEAGPIDSSWIGQWHMLTAAYDGTVGGGLDTQSLFIDGILAADRTGDFSDSGHASAFTIGYSSVFGGRELAGGIDEIAVYDRALLASEVGSIYAARLVGGVGAVPEPASWAMMILGFGTIGASLRRRRALAVAAA